MFLYGFLCNFYDFCSSNSAIFTITIIAFSMEGMGKYSKRPWKL